MKYAVKSRESRQKYEYFDTFDGAKRLVEEHMDEDSGVGMFDPEAYVIYKVDEGRFEEVDV